MATILIDKLLQACVKQGASDIHIVVGQPPVFRLHGRMRKLETKVLEPDDTVALMKSIAPERAQRELNERGSADFGFAFGEIARGRIGGLDKGSFQEGLAQLGRSGRGFEVRLRHFGALARAAFSRACARASITAKPAPARGRERTRAHALRTP